MKNKTVNFYRKKRFNFSISILRQFFFFSLVICLFCSYAQNNNLGKTLEKLDSYEEKWNFYSSSIIEIDNLEVLLKRSMPDSERLELLLFYRNKIGVRNESKGEKEALQALKIAQKLNKPLQEGMALRYLCLSTSMDLNRGKSMNYANKAIQIAETINDPVLKADVYTSLFFVHNQRENYIEAVEYFLKSVDLINKYGGHSIKNIKYIATSRISLANNNILLADKMLNKVDYNDLNLSYKKFFMKLKIDVLRKKNDLDSLKFYYNEMSSKLPTSQTFEIIADGSFQNKDLKTALEFYHKAVYHRQARSEYASILFLKIADIYNKRGINDSTEIYLEKSLENAIRFKKEHDEPKIYAALASFYLEQKQHNKSKYYANKGYAVAVTNNLTESLIDITNVLGKVSAQENRFDKAYDYLKKNRDYAEKLTKQQSLALLQKTEIDRELTMWSENQEREIAYEVAEKDKAIKFLTTENRLKTVEANQQRYIRMSLVIGAFMLTILVLIFWSRFRLKKRAFKSISEKNDENVLLMKEIHHRVKNNLQIILSLLNAQLNTLDGNEELNEALLESQNKIKSMAIIHQNLYNSNSFVSVHSMNYLNELIDHIKNSYKNSNKNVDFKINIENNEITMAMAVPLGLIVNELITNSYKYAFNNTKGENSIIIKFSKTEIGHTYKLEVKDNGVGLPNNFNIEELPSFGIQMVKGLVEQLDGQINISSTNFKGTTVEIYIKEPNKAA